VVVLAVKEEEEEEQGVQWVVVDVVVAGVGEEEHEGITWTLPQRQCWL
jgi:hypothetical protein